MVLLRGENVLRTYRIALGRNPVRAKRGEGDGRRRAPGIICHCTFRTRTRRTDMARETGVEPEGDIMVHGQRDRVRVEGDWTQGCIAVPNEEMDEIWGLVVEGTPVRIEE